MLAKLKQLFQESVLYGAGNLVTKASGLLLLPLYLLFISKEEFGLLTLYETLFVFLMVISGWGVKGGFTRWYYDMQSETDRKSLFFTSYIFNVVTSSLGVLAVALVVSQIDMFHPPHTGDVTLWFCLAGLFKLLFDLPFILLRLQQKVKTQTIYQTMNVALTVLFSYCFLEYNKQGFAGVFMAQAAANAITFLLVLPLIFKNSILRFQRLVLGEMIHYGYPLAVSNILTTVLTLSDRYIIEHYSNLGEVASFSMAFKISNVLQFLVVNSFITSYTYNYYKSMHNPDESRFHIKTFTYFVLLMTLLGLGIVLFSKEIIYVLGAGNQDFYDAIPLIPVIILGLIFSGMRSVFVLPLTKAKRTRLISIVLFVTGLFNIVLNFLLIPYWGKMAAALTTSASQLLAALWFLYMVRKIEVVNYEIGKISKVLLIGVSFCIVALYLPALPFILDVLLRLSLVLSFLLCLYWFRFFEVVELQKLRQIWSKWRNPKEMLRNIKKFNS